MRYLKDFLLLGGDRYGFRDKRYRLYNDEIILSSAENRKFHGEFLDSNTDSNIKLDKISHSIENIRKVNGNLIGDITILDTPVGMIVQGLLECGAEFITSIRAMGQINEDGVVTKLSLITFDFMEKHDGK
jgi:hypothetical protein